ncbi:class I SAM-dependent methyltransferase [Kluyvera genomosp. 1]|uniref:class I SAM-dependent methyltransferase n=1 Tax=Kluyvera genomosp. 1 TaxID=2774053 RepID=UPI00068D17E7|nr:class I SAM-dependent methyltransferase [Kluyvera genomosp. 1]
MSAREFLEISKDIEGWLYEGAAFMTQHLLSAQKSLGTNSGVLEIGVYKGKYLSFLSSESQSPTVGIDVFIFDQKEEAEKNVAYVCEILGKENTSKLIRANTRILDKKSLTSILSSAGIERLTFASIDGDHSSEGVYNDLELVESVLAPGGIIAVDDMFSSVSPAVSEGFFNYINNSESKLKPIAFSDNKLFLTTHGYDEIYQIRLQVEMHKSDDILHDKWTDGNQSARVRPFMKGTLLCL